LLTHSLRLALSALSLDTNDVRSTFALLTHSLRLALSAFVRSLVRCFVRCFVRCARSRSRSHRSQTNVRYYIRSLRSPLRAFCVTRSRSSVRRSLTFDVRLAHELTRSLCFVRRTFDVRLAHSLTSPCSLCSLSRYVRLTLTNDVRSTFALLTHSLRLAHSLTRSLTHSDSCFACSTRSFAALFALLSLDLTLASLAPLLALRLLASLTNDVRSTFALTFALLSLTHSLRLALSALSLHVRLAISRVVDVRCSFARSFAAPFD
jgi:hypothetical protein